MLEIEQVLVFVGFVVLAMLASRNQKPSLLILMISILMVGSLVIPIAFAARII